METEFYIGTDNSRCAKTVIPIEDGSRKELHIGSFKERTNLVSRASIYTRSEDGLSISCVLFEDYSEIVQELPCKRVTEKVLKAFHEEVFAKIPDILESVKEFYSKKEGK